MHSHADDSVSLEPVLPHIGQVSLEQVIAALRARSRSDSRCDLRVVAVGDPRQAKWSIFAGELRLADGASSRSEPTVISAGPIRLVRCQAGVGAIANEETFWRFARSWHEAITGQSDSAEAQTTSSIERISSRGDAGEVPGWRFSLYALQAGAANPPLPRGPFYDRSSQLFAATLGDAAAQWLERPALRSLNSPQFHLAVLLHDSRGFLGDIALDGTKLTINTAGDLARERLSLAVLATDLAGTQHQAIVDSPERTVDVQLPEGDLQRLQVFVLEAGGECLDEFYEDPYRCTRPSQRVLRSALASGLDEEVRRAMEVGEGETIEFKAMIPTDRGNAKSRELLEVACAFANTHGGVLFVGISDNVEVTGLERHLVRAGKGDLEKAREDYATTIKRMIHEGLTPAVAADVSWARIVGHDVLRVTVQGHPTSCHALVESGDVYVRRGASCAKARPSDLELKLGRTGDSLDALRQRRY